MCKRRSNSEGAGEVGRTMAKRRWRAADAREVLDAHRASGMSLVSFARRERLTLSRLTWWRRQLRERASVPVRLLPVAISTPGLGRPTSSVEIVVRGGRVIRVMGTFDTEVLGQIVQTLEGLAC
jgi:hypothetical protein